MAFTASSVHHHGGIRGRLSDGGVGQAERRHGCCHSRHAGHRRVSELVMLKDSGLEPKRPMSNQVAILVMPARSSRAALSNNLLIRSIETLSRVVVHALLDPDHRTRGMPGW